MRAFFNPTLLTLLSSVAVLTLTSCDKPKEEKKEEAKKEAVSAEATKEAVKKEVKKEESKPQGINLKIDNESEEPALKVLEKLDPSNIVARIEGEEVTVAHLIEAIKNSPDQVKTLPLSKIYTAMVKRVRDMRALVKAARAAGVSEIEDVKKKIKEAEEAVLVKHFVDEKINAKITPEYLKKQFDDFMKIYKKDGKSEKEFRLVVGIFADKAEAQNVIKRVQKGEKFDEIIAKDSTDPKVKETKGELGYVRFSELPKEVAEQVQKAATGVLIDNPVELAKDKWAVFKKMDQRDVPDPTFEEVAPDLKKVVMPQFFAEVLKDVLKGVKSELVDYKTGKALEEKDEEPAKTGVDGAAVKADAKSEPVKAEPKDEKKEEKKEEKKPA